MIMKTKIWAIVLTVLTFAIWFPENAEAQFSMRRSRVTTTAKPKTKQVIIAGTKDGVLSYLIRDGKRQSFVQKEKIWNPWCYFVKDTLDVRIPLYKSEEETVDENSFAKLLQELSSDGWILEMCSKDETGEVYVFEK